MGENHDDGAPRLSGMWVGLSEALIWIVLRDAEAARSMADAPKRTYTAVALHVAEPGRRRMTGFHDAKAGLLDKLRHGEITAQGVPGTKRAADGASRPIGATDWAALRLEDGDYSFIASSVDGAVSFQFWHDVIVQADQLVRAFPAPILPVEEVGESITKDTTPSADAIAPQIEDGQPVEAARRRGPRPQYNWSEFEAAALSKLEDEGGLSRSLGFQQRDLEAYMAEWCGKHWAKIPAVSGARTHVAAVVKQFEASKANNSSAGR